MTSDDPKLTESLRRALAAIRTLKAKVAALEDDNEHVAIVGASCRLPGASSLEAFDALLRSAEDPLRSTPKARWSNELWCGEAPGKTYATQGGFLDDVATFDAEYFGIAPREACVLDPQQRLLLELTIEALEHAAIPAKSLRKSSTGVFVGVSTADHKKLLEQRDNTEIDAWVGTGNVASTAAGRISYALDLRGPSLAIDTACSSSLVATHLACQSLLSRESDLAIAGGVQVLLDPESTVYFSTLGALSRTQRCRSFSSDADGYVRSEGCGVLILKRYSDALRDGDPILAVVQGSAVQQDGRSNGLTAPNPEAQATLIRTALRNAGAQPSDIRHIECHATATPLGDPIEVEALREVFQGLTTPITLGALKSRIGHCEAAAGVASLIAASLVVSRKRVPRNLHLLERSSQIRWDKTPFVLPSTTLPWDEGLVGVSSFGFGGTSAHAIVAAPPTRDIETHTSATWFAVSADSESALTETARRWAKRIEAAPQHLTDLAYTSLCGRSPRALRAVIAVESASQVCADLRALRAEHRTTPWPNAPTEGRRRHGPPTAWSGTQHWSVQPLVPRGHRATDDSSGAAPVATPAPSKDSLTLRELLQREISAVTGLAHVNSEDNLLDLGLDSVMALEVRNRLQELLQRRLSPTLLMERPSIEALYIALNDDAHATATPKPTPDDLGDALAKLEAQLASQLSEPDRS